ncbi:MULTISPECIES: anthrone oxygenase family protein [unclassified Rhizobium]|uniref:anthrone oxygenase family protein n=1 Tax=unclassified Rhizobium TaxID=2613769 RepID=UPI000EAA9751|nr:MULTISPECIES: anthrone oxygenase family protein [unclassified Rhizobium]AYG65544.1 DUF1772 domain-containing protein [Rhizobium sp. CCGE531]AYG72026.1 DUF1772 domain-containing protein [Rhizobium sp. CCGE532]
MFPTLQILTILIVAVAMALALAHVLELPGKMRLSKEDYLTVQRIYYPGFTIGGVSEPLGALLLLLLLFLTPANTTAFWLLAAAFAAMVAMHAAFWLLTQPVNNFWLQDAKLKGMGAGFFSHDPFGGHKVDAAVKPDWTTLRDRWEWSHAVRAALGLLAFILLVTAVAL